MEDFDEVHKKLVRAELFQDGEVVETDKGKLATFVGPEGEMISINSMQEEEELEEQKENVGDDKIKKLLSQIKI